MLLVKTQLGKSSIHGMGLFADQFIPKGTTTWKYDPKFDKGFTEDEIMDLSEENRKYFLHYAYYDKKRDLYILCCDSQRFINHSENPEKINIASNPDQDVALRDIQPGEEFLCNYNKFDDTYFDRLHIKKDDLL